VTRETFVGPNGAIFVHTIGEGTNKSEALAKLNQVAGPPIFHSLNAAEAMYIANHEICTMMQIG